MQLYSKSLLLALFCISLERLDRIVFRPYYIIFTVYIMSVPFIKIDSNPRFDFVVVVVAVFVRLTKSSEHEPIAHVQGRS